VAWVTIILLVASLQVAITTWINPVLVISKSSNLHFDQWNWTHQLALFAIVKVESPIVPPKMRFFTVEQSAIAELDFAYKIGIMIENNYRTTFGTQKENGSEFWA
jgi:hypothetical protein